MAPVLKLTANPACCTPSTSQSVDPVLQPPRIPFAPFTRYIPFQIYIHIEMGAQTLVKPSFCSDIRGRQAIFINWLTTSPFVTSFVEDSLRGTARTTRSNTLANRINLNLEPGDSATFPSSAKLVQTFPKRKGDALPESCSSSTITSTSESTDQIPRRTISFAEVAHVYSEENPGVPVEEKLKKETRTLSLEARRKRAARMAQQDPCMPTSAAGKWLLRKTSSTDLLDT